MADLVKNRELNGEFNFYRGIGTMLACIKVRRT